ncbi:MULTISPECIES: BON domain-containing protein [unclassified Vibrio]|uniref:BON domain-containing protein n=1 Tax=Vibrio sp. HB236076 TaxID=3232307 RepID=A0AB39HHL4_9VIBR|nr:BON domain-containing protein [Vibrio sp. HB161653]MDP5254532.1 BON domain-containing protein [Vibrio sp. HB161653]
MWRFLAAVLLSLHLTGCAGIFLAGAATTVNVVTDKRTTQEIWQDKNLELDIVAIGNKAPYNYKVRLVAASYQGNVVLLGQAPTQAIKQEIGTKVRELSGVKNLNNELKIQEPLPLSGISEDTWITTKIKSQLLTNSDLNGVKIRVITEDNEVYLFGYVTEQQAQIATDIARNVSGVNKVVRAFQYGQAEAVPIEQLQAEPASAPPEAQTNDVDEQADSADQEVQIFTYQ